MKTCQKCGAQYADNSTVCSACGSEELFVNEQSTQKKSASTIISAILGIVLPAIFGLGFVAANSISVILTIAAALVNILFLLSGAGFILIVIFGTIFASLSSTAGIFALLTSLMSFALIISIIITIILLFVSIIVNIASAFIIPMVTDVSTVLAILTLGSGVLGIVLSSAAIADKNKLGKVGIIVSALSIAIVIVCTAISVLTSIFGGFITALTLFLSLFLI